MSAAAGPRILISAGEPSGDVLGAGLISALRRRQPSLEFEGCGGPKMKAEGATLLAELEQLSAMGFVETIAAIPRHYRLYRNLIARAKSGRYAAAVLIDYPGFHLRLGSTLRRLGLPVTYYVAPQLWAWRPGRLGRLRRAASVVAAILPFEEQWLRTRGIEARFVGHPLLDQPRPSGTEARSELQVVAGQRVLSIFPGSRTGELRRHWPLFRETGVRLLKAKTCDAVLVGAVRGQDYPDAGALRLVYDQPAHVMAAATAALVKSGTTTLEAALAGIPAVVAYRASASTYRIARMLMTVDRISLVNLIADRTIVPELWHLPVTVDQLVTAAAPLLDDASDAHRLQREGLTGVVASLGTAGAADRVAAMVLERLAP